MEQTFINYVATDLRFWAASLTAILRSILVPFVLLGGAAAWSLGLGGLIALASAALAFAFADWCLLIVRMARRIALGIEDPNALLDRSVLGNAGYLHRAYYAGAMPTLRPARG